VLLDLQSGKAPSAEFDGEGTELVSEEFGGVAGRVRAVAAGPGAHPGPDGAARRWRTTGAHCGLWV
jgi:hypothetical protein